MWRLLCFRLRTPDGHILELRALALRDQRHKPLCILVSFVMRLDHMAVHRCSVMVAANLDRNVVPRVGIHRRFQFSQLLRLAGFRNARLAHDPDGVLADVGAAQVMMRSDGVAATEGDMRGGAKLKLRRDNHVSRVELPRAGRWVIVLRHFIPVQHTIFHLPLADGGGPAVNGLLAHQRRGLVERGRNDQLRRRDDSGRGLLRRLGLSAGNNECTDGKSEQREVE